MKHLEELRALSPATLRMVLCNAVLSARNTRDVQRVPLWSFVGRICSVGSTSGHHLCERANLNPAQLITSRLSRWADFETIQGAEKLIADNREFDTPLEAMTHVLWLIQRFCHFKPKARIGEPCDGFRFREGVVAARKLLTQLGVCPATSKKIKPKA